MWDRHILSITVMANERLISVLDDLGEFLKVRMIATLMKQGHEATGALIASIDTIVRERIGFVELVEEHIFYGDFVERGRKRGVRRVPIAAIEEWLKRRRFEFAMDNPRGAAFAVQTNIFKFGIKPSRFISSTLITAAPIIEREVSRGINEQMDILIDNLVTGFQKQLTTGTQ